MKKENFEKRKDIRFPQIGRVDISEISSMPGILDDISLSGLKMHFPYSISLNLEKEYKLKVLLSNFSDNSPLQLLSRPVWLREDENETQIGFQNLYSPDDSRLKDYIAELKKQNEFPEIK
ncbi:MAG: PilZ domain-containing protein [Treponema sp.]|nr:PilZ domain-containing protein [Treponema sp.]